MQHGIILKATLNENQIILEKLESEDLGLPVKGGKSRIIMIGMTGNQHGPRIKISKYGKGIKRNDKKSYVGLYTKDEPTGNDKFYFEGDPKNVDLRGEELKSYEDIFIRNYNLIRLAQDSSNLDDCETALLNDEKLYRDGVKYERDKFGTLIVYDDKGNISYRKNLKDDKI
jgi:hypothetical protein